VDELLAFDWTAIVLYAGHNDFGNAFFLRRYAGVSGAMNSAIRGLFGRSALYAWLRGALLQPVGGGDLHYRPGLPKLSDAEVRAAEDALDRNIRRISWRCRRAGVPLVVVVPAVDWMVAPLQVDCDGDRCPQTLYREGLAAVGRDAAEAAAKLREAGDADRQLLHVTTAAQQGMRTVDTDLVVDAERDLPRQNGASIPGHRLFMDSVHFNAQGHRAMARLLADALTKAGIAGGTGSDGRAPRGR
jgi:lysophospholipase L1-like esterase